MSCNEKLILDIKQGEHRSFEFTVTQETETGLETPINLTNCTIDFEVRKTPYISVKPILTKHITTEQTQDGYISNITDGMFVVNINETDMKQLYPDTYYVSIYITDFYGDRYSITGDGNNSSLMRICQC